MHASNLINVLEYLLYSEPMNHQAIAIAKGTTISYLVKLFNNHHPFTIVAKNFREHEKWTGKNIII